MKDWIGDSKSVFRALGASNHSEGDREKHDYYATEPKAIELLLELESFNNVLEPSCGEGHLSKVMIDRGIKVTSSDLIDRGYGEVKNFFDYTEWNGDIVTNPPYKFAQKFVEHSLKIIPEGNKVAMFLKLTFLESKGRKKLFTETPFKVLYVSSSRLNCAKNGDFNKYKFNSAAAYGWFVWDKGFTGNSIIKWFN